MAKAKSKPRKKLDSARVTAGSVILATGVFAALFFRKDSFSSPSADSANSQIVLREPVERRLPVDAHTRVPGPTFKVPTAATGMPDEEPSSGELPRTFHRTFSPVGALLKPVTDDGPEPPSTAQPHTSDDASATTHVVADGDTLTGLAERYLGSMDRYLEIFELNRDVLANPELLPIGHALKIPPKVNASTTTAAPAVENPAKPTESLAPVATGSTSPK